MVSKRLDTRYPNRTTKEITSILETHVQMASDLEFEYNLDMKCPTTKAKSLNDEYKPKQERERRTKRIYRLHDVDLCQNHVQYPSLVYPLG